MDLSELYRDIVETSPDGIWVIGLDGRTVYANPEIARIHRIPTSELAGLTVFDTLDEAGRRQFAAAPRGRRQGQLNEAEVEVQWVRSDGNILWVLCSESELLDAEGRRRALLHRYSDYTERRALIESLRASEDALEDQVAQNNLMQAVASAANEATSLAEVLAAGPRPGAAARRLGASPGLRPGRRRHATLVGRSTPKRPTARPTGTTRAAATELALAQRRYDERHLVWDERRLTLAFPVAPRRRGLRRRRDHLAPPLWRFDLIETMAVQVAEQLARVADRERAQRELAAGARPGDGGVAAEVGVPRHHEPRDPDAAQRRDRPQRPAACAPSSPPSSCGWRPASRSPAGRCSGLINDILDFSKIEAGRLELERLDFEIRPLLDAGGRDAHRAAPATRDSTWSSPCHPDVPRCCRATRPGWRRWSPTWSPTRSSSPSEGGVIVARPPPRTDDRVRLCVEVSDTGVGVSRTSWRTLRPVHAGRLLDHADLRRHRARPGDLAGDRRGDGRRPSSTRPTSAAAASSPSPRCSTAPRAARRAVRQRRRRARPRAAGRGAGRWSSTTTRPTG